MFLPEMFACCGKKMNCRKKNWPGSALAYIGRMLGQFERGERNVSLENIERLAKALKVPASRLMEATEKK